MRRSLLAALAVLLLVTACGRVRESRLNPFNWFGRSERVQKVEEVAPDTDPRPLVDQVLSMSVEPYPGGAIVRATGLPPTQGWWNAELVARPVEDGVLVYEFRLTQPPEATPAGTQPSREIAVAASVSDIGLTDVREIVVQGTGNARSSRR